MSIDLIIRTIIIGVLAVPGIVMSLTHNMHMFQQNGYKNGEHINWLKRTGRRQWLLFFACITGLLRVVLGCLYSPGTDSGLMSVVWGLMWALDIISIITLILIYYVFRAMNRLNNKKKLVYTPRVKRMIITITVVMAVLVLLALVFVPKYAWAGVIMIISSLQWILDVLANIINHPIEKAGHDRFIRSAQKKLSDNKDLIIIGVTGSYGKTSVKYYLKTLLSQKFDVLITPESYNTPLGVVKTINEQLKSTHQIFVCEMGARHVGDIKEICDIVHPHHGVITSIGPQHLETFFSMDNIKSTKFELADALPEGGMLILNGDNEYIRDKALEYKNTTFYHAAGDRDGYFATDIKLSEHGTDFVVHTPEGESMHYQMRLVGEHNVINVVGAIAVAHKLGIALSELNIPIRRLEPVEHRMQLRPHGDMTIIDDAYNSNPVGSKAAVETLKLFEGIRILITPGMVELGDMEEEYNYKFGTYAADCCDYIILVGRDHIKPILNGAKDSGFDPKRIWTFDTLSEAMSQANAIRGEGHKYILLENDLTDNYN